MKETGVCLGRKKEEEEIVDSTIVLAVPGSLNTSNLVR